MVSIKIQSSFSDRQDIIFNGSNFRITPKGLQKENFQLGLSEFQHPTEGFERK